LTALENRFAKAQSNLNPSRRRLLRMILENPEDTYYLSSRELAKRYQVDAATVVRTIQVLGYRKFAEFVADLRAHFVTRITPYTVLKAASKEKRTVADRVRQNMELDLRNLQALQTTFDPSRIVTLAKQVKKARRIINVQRRVRSLTSKDLLIAISFGQCLRDTVEAAQRAKRQGVPTFGITDSETTPIAHICDQTCFASVASPSFGGSYVAPMSLLGALLMACAHMQTARALKLLRRSEEEDRADHRWYHQSSQDGEGRE
jgi:DNA-binding MurR/RpiR family transcriptional regulator